MKVEEIGMMLYKKGWTVICLVNDLQSHKRGSSQVCLKVKGKRGNYILSVLAGGEGIMSNPHFADTNYQRVEVHISFKYGVKTECIGHVNESELRRIINAPSRYV